MRKITLYLVASIVSALLVLLGCGGRPLTMNKIQFVEQGMSSSSLLSMVKEEPNKVFTVVDPASGLEYPVYMFYMQTGTKNIPSGYWSGEIGMYIMQYDTVPVSEDFAFLFFEDSLLFWGFLTEFARSDDELMRRLAPIMVVEAKQPIKKEIVNGTD
jgi:hypothetical protein